MIRPLTALAGLAAAAIVAHSSADALAGNVLVLGDADANATVQAALTAGGHNVTISPVIEYAYDGTNPSPSSFCTVVHLNGDTYSFSIPVAGQLALESYVQAGGGFVGMEWNAYEEFIFTQVNMPNLTLGQRTSGMVGTLTYSITVAGQTAVEAAIEAELTKAHAQIAQIEERLRTGRPIRDKDPYQSPPAVLRDPRRPRVDRFLDETANGMWMCWSSALGERSKSGKRLHDLLFPGGYMANPSEVRDKLRDLILTDDALWQHVQPDMKKVLG